MVKVLYVSLYKCLFEISFTPQGGEFFNRLSEKLTLNTNKLLLWLLINLQRENQINLIHTYYKVKTSIAKLEKVAENLQNMVNEYYFKHLQHSVSS
jgi:hypothetical protein